jgi:hypothetical protein
MSPRHKNSQLRQRIAYETARLLVADPTLDPGRARRKVAVRIGLGANRHWPSNAEVQDALSQEQRLFRPYQPEALRNLRLQALAAMRHFSRFRPRLVGPVLEGTADQTSRVRLHLFADTPDDVLLTLMEQRIPWEQRDLSLRYTGGVCRAHPIFRFVAGGVLMELVVLPPQAFRNPPLSPSRERPERGIDAGRLAKLLVAVPEEAS